MDNPKLFTRGAVRAGIYPAPPPLFSPAQLSFGTVDSGDLLDLDTPAIDPSMRLVASAAQSVASPAARPTHAPALRSVTSVARPSSAVRTGDDSSMQPSSLSSSVGWNDDDRGSTPVNHRTHREHGELDRNTDTHNSVSEPVTAREARSMSLNELEMLARRHEAYAAKLRAALKHQQTPDVDQGPDCSDVEEDVSATKGNAPEKTAGSEKKPAPADNWGDVSVLQNLSEANAKAQHEISANYGKNIGHTDSFLEFSPLRMPSPMRRSSHEDPKSPAAMKAETHAELPKAMSKADKPATVVPPVVAPPVAPRPQPMKATPEAEFVDVKPQKTELDVPVPNRAANNANEVKSGLTAEEMVALIMKRINALQLGQGAGKEPLKARADSPHKVESSASRAREVPAQSSALKARETHIPRGTTPGRFAAENFFEKALRGVPMSPARLRGSPEDPSDSSSSESDSSSDRSSCNGHMSSWRSSSSRRLSSKRKRARDRKQRMLLKPIPPSRYNGAPDANAIQRFAREANTYVTMGHVPVKQQVYFVSYYLDGKALDFYNQVVVKDEEEWDLRRFCTELFEFCFPVDFRNTQRERLNKCFQSAKDVAAHIAEWSEIYNTIGLEDTQEKVVMLFNSLTYPIQTEIYRKDLDPEVATWDQIVKAASAAEILVKLEKKNREKTETESQYEDEESAYDESEYPDDDDADAPADNGDNDEEDKIEDSSTREHGGRTEMPQAKAETMCTAVVGAEEQPLSTRQRDEFMRKGLCFNCGGRGHRARDCPSPKSQRVRNESGIYTHAMYISNGSPARDALYQSTEMGNSLHVGSIRFETPLEVEEGGVEPIEFFDDFDTDFDAKETNVDSEIDHAGADIPLTEVIADSEKTDQTTRENTEMQDKCTDTSNALEGATESCEVLEPEVENKENPDFLKLKEELMQAYNAHMGAEGKADVPPPVDPVNLSFDPLIPSTDVHCKSAEHLRHADICWVTKDVKGKEEKQWVREGMGAGLGTKEVEGALGSKSEFINVEDAAAAATTTTTARNFAVPHIASDSISDLLSSPTIPIITPTHSEEGEVFDYHADTVLMGNV